jgi:hypothetical protein
MVTAWLWMRRVIRGTGIPDSVFDISSSDTSSAVSALCSSVERGSTRPDSQ